MSTTSPAAISAPDLADGDRWATVARSESETVATHRHIVAEQRPTSVCGITALPFTMWRANRTRPACPACVERYTAHDGQASTSGRTVLQRRRVAGRVDITEHHFPVADPGPEDDRR